MSDKAVPIVCHNDGTSMPAIGLGTYTSIGGTCEQAVKDAIDIGYRLIDTAFFYENEAEVGRAIRDKIDEGVITRQDVYLVSKLWCHHHEPHQVERALRLSLKNFGLDYLDCYLMHWPYSYVFKGDDQLMPTDANGKVLLSNVDFMDTWHAMEKLVDLGLTKSIGVSNFNTVQLTRLLAECKIKPIHNQIECHPGLDQSLLIDLCKKNNIIVTAYCPLGRPNIQDKLPEFMFDPHVKAVADKYKKTIAQVVLRYVYELGTVPLPKSTNKERIKENFEIFDFKLTLPDRFTIESFRDGQRVIPMLHARDNINYPFHTI